MITELAGFRRKQPNVDIDHVPLKLAKCAVLNSVRLAVGI
jgi:hypothetical protein